MDFSGLVKAVQDFWNFIWPPVVCLGILSAIFAFLAPSSFRSGWARLRAVRPSAGTQVAFFKGVKRFGFDKLMPILGAFFMLFVLNGVKNLVVQTGELVPPKIIYDQERLLLAHADSIEVRALWYKTKTPADIADFRGRIERVISDAKETHKNSPILGSVATWENKSGEAHVAFSACKFFMLFSILIGVLEMKNAGPSAKTILRTALVVLIFLSTSILFSLRFVWAVEQTFYATTRAAQLFLPEGTPPCDPRKDGCKDYYSFIEAARQVRSAPDRWWTVSGTDLYSLQWLKRQALQEME